MTLESGRLLFRHEFHKRISPCSSFTSQVERVYITKGREMSATERHSWHFLASRPICYPALKGKMILAVQRGA